MNKIKKNLVLPILMIIGMLLFAAYSVTDRFITPLSDWIAIPVILIAVVLMIIGIVKMSK